MHKVSEINYLLVVLIANLHLIQVVVENKDKEENLQII